MKAYLNDTIAAVSTPVGAGGIAVIRISGQEALNVAKRLFSRRIYKSHEMKYGKIIWRGDVLDECMLTYMKAPKTYTAEDTVEISCHGGIQSMQKILEAVYASGARPAEPGEFTKRAFLNGRIDLTQAEAVMDLINARTSAAHAASVRQLGGAFSKKIKTARDELLMLIAQIEVVIDYPEHDVGETEMKEIEKTVSRILEDIKNLYETAETGKIIKEGINTVILGAPNVGKSSLLNALLDEERAIVTDIAGTTRDVLQEYINISGIPLKISDTAGIRETEDVIEKIGVTKSKDAVERAELVLLVLDASRQVTDDDMSLLKLAEGKKILVLLNKCDLGIKIETKDISEKVINISAKTGLGLDKLSECIKEMFISGSIDLENDLLVTGIRHKNSLYNAADRLNNALNAISDILPEDFISLDLKEAYEFLGEITGETLQEDIIDKIFSEFCLGK